MKVVINNLAWIDRAGLDEVTLHILRNDLTIVPRATSSFNADPNPIRLYALTPKWIGVPRAYYEQKKKVLGFSFEEESQIAHGVPLSTRSNLITLRAEDQEPDVSAFVQLLQQKKFGIFDAYTGYGKSYSGMEIVRRIGVNTVFLMHRESLMDQWIRDIRVVWPEASIGIVKGKKVDYEGKDLTFAMVQSLMNDEGDKLPKEFWSNFGLLFVDEIQSFGGEKFGSVAPRFSAEYCVGCSGTVRRLDKCEKVFNSVLGDVLVKANPINRVHPKIYVRIPPSSGKNISSSMEKPQLVSLITRDSGRNKFIAEDVVKAVKAGRHPIVMSERIELLEKIDYFIKKIDKSITTGYYIGGKKEQELLVAAEQNVILTTVQMMKEGINLPIRDTLMLVTPQADVEQACCPPGQLVWIGNNLKKIEDVVVGDKATTAKPPRDVLITHKNPHDGKMFTISANRLLPFSVTGNHKILVKWSERNEGEAGLSGKIARWMKAEDIYNLIISEEYVTTAKNASRRLCVNVPVIQGITQHTALNPRRCRLLGYFIAEGSINHLERVNKRNEKEIEANKIVSSGCCVAFHFNINEKNYHNDVISIIKDEFGVDCWLDTNKKTHTTSVKCSSVHVAKFIETFVTGLQPERMMSVELMTLRTDWQLIILETAMYGDGSIGKDGQMRYHTSSAKLAIQFQQFLFRSKMISSILVCHHKEDANRFSTKDSYEVHMHPNSRNIGWFVVSNNQIPLSFWAPISKIIVDNYKGDVYNLSVDEHHFYCLAGGTVHNCGRICRRVPGKKTPFVLDYVDVDINKFKGSFVSRYKLYKGLGWEVNGANKIGL
jgi:hypothetical protein